MKKNAEPYHNVSVCHVNTFLPLFGPHVFSNNHIVPSIWKELFMQGYNISKYFVTADINANIQLLENENKQNLNVPVIRYNPISEFTFLCQHRGFGFHVKNVPFRLEICTYNLIFTQVFHCENTRTFFKVLVQVLWMNLQFYLTRGQSQREFRPVASDPDVTPAHKAHGSMPSQQQTGG